MADLGQRCLWWIVSHHVLGRPLLVMSTKSKLIAALRVIRVYPTLLFASAKGTTCSHPSSTPLMSRTRQQYFVLTDGSLRRVTPKKRTISGKRLRRNAIAFRRYLRETEQALF